MKKDELQVENGHFTRIVNPLIEELVKIPFKGCELAVALFIIRKTYGFQKKQDQISLTQFQKGLCRSRPTIIKALENLRLVNIALLVKEGQKSLWSINKYYTTWQLVNTGLLVKRNVGKLVNTGLHTKETTKEINTPATRGSLSTKNKTMKKNSFRYQESQPSDTFEDVVDADSGAIVKDKTANASSKMKEIIAWAENERGGKFLNYPKQLKALSILRKNAIPPSDIKNRWKDLERDKFYKTKGLDFMDIVNSFDKKPK